MLSNLYKRHPYLVLTACLTLYFYPFLRMLSLASDEGSLIDGAFRVTQGQLPFRDFFEVMGPATFYLLALFFKVFGTAWWTTRLYLGLMGLTSALLLYFLARRLNAGIQTSTFLFLLAIACVPFQWPAISHHLDSNVFAMAAFALLLSWLDHQHPTLLILAGFFTAMTTGCMLPKGVLILLAFLLLVILRLKAVGLVTSLALLFAGFVPVGLLMVLYFWWAGGLSDLFYALVQWPLTQYSEVNAVPYGHALREIFWSWQVSLSGVPAPIRFSLASIIVLPAAITVCLPLILAALCLRLRRKAFTTITLPYWLVGSALWFSEMHRTDLPHIMWGAPILVILCFHLLAIEPDWLSALTVRVAVISAVVLASCNVILCLGAQSTINTPRGVVHAFTTDPVLTFATTHVKTGDTMFVYPWEPKYYFLTGVDNPTRFSGLRYHANTDQQFREVVRNLEERKVRYVVWNTHDAERATFVFPHYQFPGQASLIVEPYLNQHYRVIGEGGEYTFLERK